MTTRGVLFVHSTPSAVCPHVEWAVAGVMGVPAQLDWTPQPASAGAYRTELSWQCAPGTAAGLASALRGWPQMRYEVTEEPSPGCEGARYSYTPSLGLFHAVTGPHGDVVLPEDRIKAAMERAARGEVTMEAELTEMLGKPWDDELETFRYAGEGAPVRWLHAVV